MEFNEIESMWRQHLITTGEVIEGHLSDHPNGVATVWKDANGKLQMALYKTGNYAAALESTDWTAYDRLD